MLVGFEVLLRARRKRKAVVLSVEGSAKLKMVGEFAPLYAEAANAAVACAEQLGYEKVRHLGVGDLFYSATLPGKAHLHYSTAYFARSAKQAVKRFEEGGGKAPTILLTGQVPFLVQHFCEKPTKGKPWYSSSCVLVNDEKQILSPHFLKRIGEEACFPDPPAPLVLLSLLRVVSPVAEEPVENGNPRLISFSESKHAEGVAAKPKTMKMKAVERKIELILDDVQAAEEQRKTPAG